MEGKMERIDAQVMGVFERIWKAQGREGTFAEFVANRVLPSEEERVRRNCESENKKPGELNKDDGYNCPKCLNRGDIWVPANNGSHWFESFRKCDCWKVRASIRRMKASGLENTLHKLSEFEAVQPFQQEMLAKARAYLAEDHSNGASLFMGGAVGSGKTFICAAVCRELLHAGHEVIYMQWVTEAQRLKAIANDDSAADEIAAFSHAEYLYIDDLFKPTGQNAGPTPADIRLAYDIINYRYVNKLPMIVSTEKYMPELLALDEATASRLYERAKGFSQNIKRDPTRNYRMKGADELI